MNFLLKSIFLFICTINLINCDDDQVENIEVVFRYKQNVTIDCSKFDDAEYYRVYENGTEVVLDENIKNVKIEDKKLSLVDLRSEDIRDVEYFCRLGEKKVAEVTKLISPFIYAPEKPSQTVTEGSNIELSCKSLYGDDLSWKWLKNDTELVEGEKYSIKSEQNLTTLTINAATEDDKGDFVCELSNKHGTHTQVIRVRVKDALAALWPFLAICAEVLILCMIILIYEKKCVKKTNENEEEMEQAQNLMGKDNADLKKRTTKA
ncbi:neuroplastin isoform X3 [Brachionus plicatilis]|uniref:Neuroplastin isoform X3 n=1 Tax=Brachionus plicatilis TaxID=10195 RepID=A0A3M7PZ27_BRAPC|nr:neuroplastin isoform X3 [Brachionus plicatilis]